MILVNPRRDQLWRVAAARTLVEVWRSVLVELAADSAVGACTFVEVLRGAAAPAGARPDQVVAGCIVVGARQSVPVGSVTDSAVGANTFVEVLVAVPAAGLAAG